MASPLVTFEHAALPSPIVVEHVEEYASLLDSSSIADGTFARLWPTALVLSSFL